VQAAESAQSSYKKNIMKTKIQSNMRIFKIVAVLLTLLIGSLIVESCGGKCPKRLSTEYSIKTFCIFPLDSNTIMVFTDDAQSGSAENNPHIFRKDFGIKIAFYTTGFITAKHEPVRSLFIQSAYALDCLPPIRYPIDSIVSIQIFSDRNFGKTHLAGTDIAEFFRIVEWSRKMWQFISFEEYLQRPAPTLDGDDAFYLPCLITATNVELGEHNFRIVVKLSDERILEQSIKAILE
jgi:hypothetical protein